MGLEFIKPGTNIDFLKYRKIAYLVSAAIILAGMLSLAVKGGPRYGVDFAGGLTIQVKFDKAMDVADIRKAIEPVGLEGLVVQRFGQETDNEYLVRATEQQMAQELVREAVVKALGQALPDSGFQIQRLEMVGPKVGADLRSKAIEAVFYAVLLIAIYISGRFEHRWMASGIMAAGLTGGVYLLNLLSVPTGYLIFAAMAITLLLCWYMRLKFALGAVVADLHDVLVTIGLFSLLDMEFDLTIVAALLTILGYSLNDTIIVYDRIRETLRGADKKESLADIINRSINQTLSRTILTSGTTLAVTLCLYLFGGAVIHDFALALLIGIVAGTYSSIFIASPILLDLGSGFIRKEQVEAVVTERTA
ncbi:protein translocase subunit SecF [Desulfolutivibrio sulfoxidireducens]|uniref:protein translocase subunit SecF n=1 Tax=Desulfolutivibrio sulfoxidireducens TaxID=2773299 RepID=UPI00159D100F|nr:protein translocase subunit SecF [Desulfolutivibrio sulfoxidireducens]QLA18172.1 protein translocase subunit SecF [Desulfolutivibrio sulfoxidireducens]